VSQRDRDWEMFEFDTWSVIQPRSNLAEYIKTDVLNSFAAVSDK